LFQTIDQLIQKQHQISPNAIALGSIDRPPLTYEGLFQQVLSTKDQLQTFGIHQNDRVAMILPNGPELAASFLAISSAATTAPLNPSYRRTELDFYFQDLEVSAVVVEGDQASVARDVAFSLNIPILEIYPVLDAPAGTFALQGRTGKPQLERRMAKPEDVALVLHTSGTTSKPKIVPLKHRNLLASAENIRISLQLTAQDQCLNIMPLFHIHGLMASVMASMASGASVICSPGFYASKFFEWLETFKPTWYTAVPTMHQAILDRALENRDILENIQLRFIRSCSASLPPQTMEELERVFHAPVVEAYGMTEASHQMSCNPLPPRIRKKGSVGVATGVEVAIMAEDRAELLPNETAGEIVIRGLNVTEGYANNPDANAKAFSKGWFRTGDQGYLDSDQYLYITGRIKEIINRGGEKISPREVDEVLLEHPFVSQAVTFAMPDPTLGEDVAAAVIATDPTLSEAELRRFANTRLAFFKVPRRIIFLEEIPKGPTGKLQRIGLADKLGIEGVAIESRTAEVEYVPPRDPIEERLSELWKEVLNVEPIGVHHDFLSVGGDSLLALQLVSRIREALDLDISLLDFFDAPTIAEQASIIQEMFLKELGNSNASEG
jgi:acyl-CoA synthetase (AMP-forming)/AMP-acid ligase II/acyl carrier protein